MKPHKKTYNALLSWSLVLLLFVPIISSAIHFLENDHVVICMDNTSKAHFHNNAESCTSCFFHLTSSEFTVPQCTYVPVVNQFYLEFLYQKKSQKNAVIILKSSRAPPFLL